jgi:hypothetical protein
MDTEEALSMNLVNIISVLESKGVVLIKYSLDGWDKVLVQLPDFYYWFSKGSL